jgi:glycolate oxidase FAD binding subunit
MNLESLRVDATLSLAGVVPGSIVTPADRPAFAQTVRDLYAAGTSFAFFGGGTERDLGNPPRGLDTLVCTTRLNRVIEYAPEDQTITVEGGMTLEAIDAVLTPHGQMLPIDVGDRGRTTIGGAIATNAFGVRRHRYGSLKDMIVGVEFVRPDGTRARGGGKVVKNVAGFDLPKLAVGSLGTLGAIVSATLRVHPRPEASETIVVRKLRRNVEEGDALLAALTAARLEPTAVAWHRAVDGAPTYVIFEGGRAAVDAQVERALAIASQIAGSAAVASVPERIAFWEYERDVRRRGAWRACSYTAPSLVNLAHDTAFHAWSGAQLATCYPSLGVFFASGVDDGRSIDDVTATVRITRLEALGETIFHTMPPRWRGYVDAWGDPPPSFGLMRALKAQFDPKDLCNAGRYVGGI